MGIRVARIGRLFFIIGSVVLLVFIILRLWLYPVGVIPCKLEIGSISLDHQNSRLDAFFIAPKGGISAISFALPVLQCDADLTCLSLHVYIVDVENENVVMDEVKTSEHMQWTNWHVSKSFTLAVSFNDCLLSGNRYSMKLEVLTPALGNGTADVYLHWLDLRYLWGRERQELFPVINDRKTCQEGKPM